MRNFGESIPGNNREGSMLRSSSDLAMRKAGVKPREKEDDPKNRLRSSAEIAQGKVEEAGGEQRLKLPKEEQKKWVEKKQLRQ